MWLMQPRNKGRGFNAQPRIGCWTWLPGRYWPTISARPVYLILIRQPCMYIWSLTVVEEVLVHNPPPQGSTRQDPMAEGKVYARISPHLCVHWSFRVGGGGIIYFFSSSIFSSFSFSIEFERTIEGIGRGEGKDRIFNLARIIEREREKRKMISGWWIRDGLSRSKLISIGIRPERFPRKWSSILLLHDHYCIASWSFINLARDHLWVNDD